MEVKPGSPVSFNQYINQLRRQSIIIIVCFSLLATTYVGTLLLLSHVASITQLFFWLIIAVVLVCTIATGYVTYRLVARPFFAVLAAFAYTHHEPTSLKLPNTNDGAYQKTPIQSILAGLYADATEQTNQPTSDQSTDVLKRAFNSSSCGVVILDHNRSVIYANQAAPVRYNDQSVGVISLLFNGSDTVDSWLDTCKQTSLRASKIWNRIPDKIAGDENQRIFDIYANYEKGGSGFETILFFIDRTELYSSDENALNFTAFAAHELRGPLTVIKGYLDVFKEELGDGLSQDQKELLARLIVSANRLGDYINNILNTARYDRRHLSVHLSEDSVADIINSIKDDMILRARAQNRLLAFDIPENLPTIAADRSSLDEVFGNLIENAIKYSYDGGAIEVSAKQAGEFISVSVTDHGIGMPTNVVANLFQKFYRSQRSRESISGTGLGLYISKAIVESHGGTIDVHSTEGKGSIFTVSLPIYATVADKLKTDNSELIRQAEGRGWIKNHAKISG